MIPLRYPVLVAIAALGIPLLVAAQVPERQVVEKEKRTPTQSVADSLDRIIQPRFQRDVGSFGVSRLVPFIAGHISLGGSYTFAPTFKANPVPRTATEKEETRHLEDARRSGNDFVIAFLHIMHSPGRADTAFPRPSKPPGQERLAVLAVRDDQTQQFFTFPGTADSYATERKTGAPELPKQVEAAVERAKANAALVSRWEQAAINALPELKRGKPVESVVGDYVLAMRPVQAKQESCLGCHTGAKQDETLGVMVYAIARNPVRSAAK